MKTLFTALVALLLLSSCVTQRNFNQATGVENLKREDYTLLPNDTVVAKSLRVYLVALPIGGKKPWELEKQARDKMMTKNNYSGLTAEKYIHKKVWVPLLLVSVVYRWTVLSATPYLIK